MWEVWEYVACVSTSVETRSEVFSSRLGDVTFCMGETISGMVLFEDYLIIDTTDKPVIMPIVRQCYTEPCCHATLQVRESLQWTPLGPQVNTTNATLYYRALEGLRPNTGYAVRVSIVYRSGYPSKWPTATQATFFTLGMK